MDSENDSCQHLRQIEDYHEGTIICVSCGLVISNLFLNQLECVSQIDSQEQNKILIEIQNLLDRIHVPICYAHHIESYYFQNFTTKSRNSLIFSIYKVLNNLGIPISLREIANVTSVRKESLSRVKCDFNCISIDNLSRLDKYGTMLGLCYKTITLIKKELTKLPVSGHNPNSILASVIYQVAKKEKKKISLKQVSDVTSISCISIQRYNNFCKNVHGSQRR